MSTKEPTYIGQVASVSGAVVRVRLREDMPSPLVLIEGESYRVGQIGAYVRIPLGYSQLYAVCTQVGADAAPSVDAMSAFQHQLETGDGKLSGFRWMSIVLFGEGVAEEFDRGVSQYPTVGDEVHLVTNRDLSVIYGRTRSSEGAVAVGRIAGSTGIAANIDIAGLVTRHSLVVGSTGAGKSNLVTVLLESVSGGELPCARTIVIDPHGEYASALGDRACVFKTKPDASKGEQQLRVPFWALPFKHIQELTLGPIQPNHEAAIREVVLEMKQQAATKLASPPPAEVLTADSPIPFSVKKLWHDLDEFEQRTFPRGDQTDDTLLSRIQIGDPATLKPTKYPAASSYNQEPFQNKMKRNLVRQLGMMRSRLQDARYSFLFNPGGGYDPDLDGKVEKDLNELVASWVGHGKPISIFDMSGVPSDVRPTIIGTMLRVVYDMLFWGQELPVGGKQQPLLIVLDEAHVFVPNSTESVAHETLAMIAKEGRKYGTGLMLVTQRPSELDTTVISQCGSMIALRLTNTADRGRVSATVPDDLGGLVDQLPTLRTGEGLFLGEIMPIPSRVRIRKARNKPVGDDPRLPDQWKIEKRPDPVHYAKSLANWRAQSMLPDEPASESEDKPSVEEMENDDA